MTELSHDTADDAFHEIQLSGKQLVFLFIVTTTVIVVVFLCGVKVGRGVRAVQGAEPDQVPAAATATAAVPSPPQPVAEAGPPAAEPPAPPADDTPDELSYHKRLQGDKTPTETVKRAEDPKPAPPKPSPAAASSTTAATAAASTPKKPSGATEAAALDAGVPSSGKPGMWVVQVIATRDPQVATTVVKKLAGKGYPAFLVSPGAGAAQPFYKVHVGRYNDRGEAEQISTRIKKEEQFQSWITR